MGSKTLNLTYYHDAEGYTIAEIPVEVTISWDETAPYIYGADADGRRGEVRTDIKDVTVEDVIIPTEGDLSESLCDRIREYFEEQDYTYAAGDA